VDGILLASTDLYSIGKNQFRPDTPVVLFDRVPHGYRGAAVAIDNMEAAYKATQCLVQLGHSKLAFIAGRMDLSTARDRAEGFRKALEDSHLPLEGEYFKRGDFSPEGGYRNGLELMRLDHPPTAILCSNGPMTLGLLRATQEIGIRCPDELSVIGFDEPAPDTYGFSFGSLLKPELTVVAQPGYQMGSRAAQILLKQLSDAQNGEQHPDQGVVTLTAELRIRSSVGPPPKQ
jgi:LacI family transcriptional regulator